jgi:hypothetical protein
MSLVIHGERGFQADPALGAGGHRPGGRLTVRS